MITVSEAIVKMIDLCHGSQYDICHFMKVWAYASTKTGLALLDSMYKEQET